ncbi:MAG: glycoside hydrolase family 43 protein [Victivallales bacterium]|nr:glycoside hydrolase family 43 protein [Victivallales bacterium]
MLKEYINGELYLDNKGIHINAHGAGFIRVKDTWYWYGDHKLVAPWQQNAQCGVHLYTSKDLLNWTDCGFAFDIRNGINEYLKPGCVMARPKVLYCRKTKKYVLFFHWESDSSYRDAKCGIALADRPEGPFEFVKLFYPDAKTWPLNFPVPDDITNVCEKWNAILKDKSKKDHEIIEFRQENSWLIDFEEGQQLRDFTAWQDEDGSAYLIYASERNYSLHISRLTDDYLSCSGEWIRVFVGRFMEAPAIFKKDGKYYFIGSDCTGWTPNAARSAVADSMLGEWRELGNPAVDEGADITYHSQATWILELKDGRKIYVGDRFFQNHIYDSSYMFLPITFEDGRPVIHNTREWRGMI